MKKFKGKEIKTTKENSLYNEKHLLEYFKNEEDSKYYSRGSDRYIDCVCPTCKTEKKVRAHNLFNNGFTCSFCKDTMSYPERFLYSYLTVRGIEFETQKKLKGLRRYFDFYLPEENIAIETHGEQHYTENVNSSWVDSYHKSKESEDIKREYCKDNNITLVELDCSKSYYKYIEESVNNSILPNINNEDREKILKEIITNKKGNTANIIEDFKSGVSITAIAKKYEVDYGHVVNVAKKYDVYEEYYKDIRVKKVYCFETNTIYESTSEAEKLLSINKGNVYRVANGSRNFCRNKDKNKFTFKYV